MTEAKPTTILSGDLLICDAKVERSGVPELEPLLQKFADDHKAAGITLKPGGKYELTEEEFKAWEKAIEGKATYSAGGSAGNTLTVLKKLMGDKVDVKFIGAYGDDKYGRIIADSVADSQLSLVPARQPVDGVKTAVSVVVNNDSDRMIFTYRGNSGRKIPQLVKPYDLVRDADIVLLPASIWDDTKYGKHFVDALAQERFLQNKELWITLPTSPKVPAAQRQRFRYLLPSTTGVMANADELLNTSLQDNRINAIIELSEDTGKLLDREARKKRFAFITDGHQPSRVIDGNQRPIEVEVEEMDPAAEPIYKLGAGDASFAGFFYSVLTQREMMKEGQRQDIDYELCAKIGHAMARETMKISKARLDDPLDALKKKHPKLFAELHGQQRAYNIAAARDGLQGRSPV